MATSLRAAKAGPEKPNGQVATHISQAPRELTGYDLFNQILSQGLDPYKAVPDQAGRPVSAYANMEQSLGTDAARKLFTAAYLFNNDRQNAALKGEQRLGRFYETISNDPALQGIKDKIRNYTGQNSPTAVYRTSPLLPLAAQPVATPIAYNAMKK